MSAHTEGLMSAGIYFCHHIMILFENKMRLFTFLCHIILILLSQIIISHPHHFLYPAFGTSKFDIFLIYLYHGQTLAAN